MIEIIETYSRINLIHHVTSGETLWGTSNRRILRKHPGGEWSEFARFPFCPPRDFLEIHRLTARASRVDQSNVYENRLEKVLGIRGGCVYRIEKNRPPIPIGTIRGDSILRKGIAEDSNGACYFGEYFRNTEREPVRIWKTSPDLDRLEVAYEFPAGTLRHVHGIHRDPFEEEVFWVTAGDRDGECYFYRTSDLFRTMERLGEGTQVWRAVSLLFTPESICWLTDSHLKQNHACRMKRSDGKLEIGQPVDCSGWYATRTREGVYIAFLTVEKGPAIRDDRASILASPDGFSWKRVGSFKKDRWRPMRIFKYGVLSCPSGELSLDDFYLSGEGLVGLDGKSVRVRIRLEG